MSNQAERQVFETLIGLGDDPTSGVYLEPGCDNNAIGRLQALAVKELKEKLPEGFVRLLRLTNGAQINGAYFKTAEHLVAENLDLALPDVIVLGNSGNVSEFIFDKRDKKFHAVKMGFPDEKLASYESFEALLLAVLKEQQVIKG